MRKKVNLVMFVYIAFALFSLNYAHLSANWTPQECLKKEYTKTQNDLKCPEFLELKEKVVNYLTNSWCSPRAL